jgi:hypothetical protein
MTKSPVRVLLPCGAGLLLALPLLGRAADPYARVVVVTRPSPYWGYTYAPYIESPLHGMADIVRSQGDWMRAHGDYLIKNQQASMLREKVRQEHLVTRAKELQYWEWERDFRTNEYNRQLERVRERQVVYNMNFPAVGEIITAKPLNSLRDELVKRPNLPAAGSTPVEAEWLAHIHVTVSGRDNIGLLKDDRILWPRLLFRKSFTEDREKVEQQMLRAKELALSTDRDQAEMARVLDDLEKTIRCCERRLDEEMRAGVEDPECSPRHQIDARKFFRQLTDTVFLLEKPDAAAYLAPLQGRTVAELVAHMKKNGLSFAPATVGCERYYVALHRALADEVTRIRQMEMSPGRR